MRLFRTGTPTPSVRQAHVRPTWQVRRIAPGQLNLTNEHAHHSLSSITGSVEKIRQARSASIGNASIIQTAPQSPKGFCGQKFGRRGEVEQRAHESPPLPRRALPVWLRGAPYRDGPRTSRTARIGGRCTPSGQHSAPVDQAGPPGYRHAAPRAEPRSSECNTDRHVTAVHPIDRGQWNSLRETHASRGVDQ
jgi:hypothetical protein